MNLKKQLFTILSLFCSLKNYSSASAAASTSQSETAITKPLNLGTAYQLPSLPNQDTIFTPEQKQTLNFSNLWGLLLPNLAPENPHDHVLKILQNGQMNSACSLTSTTLETLDPKFLKLLELTTSEACNNLRTTSEQNKFHTITILEEHRKKLLKLISSTHLLLSAIKLSTTTQQILTAENKHLFSKAIEEAVTHENELFEIISKEHAALITVLAEIKKQVE